MFLLMANAAHFLNTPTHKIVLFLVFEFSLEVFNSSFKNSLIIHEENTKKNHKRVVSLYVDKDFPSFT